MQLLTTSLLVNHDVAPLHTLPELQKRIDALNNAIPFYLVILSDFDISEIKMQGISVTQPPENPWYDNLATAVAISHLIYQWIKLGEIAGGLECIRNFLAEIAFLLLKEKDNENFLSWEVGHAFQVLYPLKNR